MVAGLGVLRTDGRVARSGVLLTLGRQAVAHDLWLTHDFDILMRQDVIELADSLIGDVIVRPSLRLRKREKRILQEGVRDKGLKRFVLWRSV